MTTPPNQAHDNLITPDPRDMPHPRPPMAEYPLGADQPPVWRLDGKVAVVTGGGAGLGRGCALALAAAGAEVALIGRNPAPLAEVAAEIRSLGRDAWELPCDVTQGAEIVQALAMLPRVDILINNAGRNIPEPFLSVSEEHLDALLTVNLRGLFLVAQHTARRMESQGQGGAIVMMSSQMGHVGAANRTVYCMTKHGVEGLTKALAVELAPHNIRVNAVAPTFIETPMTRPFFADPVFLESVLRRIPLGRLGQIAEVAQAVVFLASPAAALITGASLVVDGGWTAQ